MSVAAEVRVSPGVGSWLGKAKAYVSLTKPRIIEQLLITTVPAMIVAQEGMPSLWLIFATLIGGTLSAGGANAVNMWWDRDIDAVMRRTSRRPLVQGTLTPNAAITFAILLQDNRFRRPTWVRSETSEVQAVSPSACCTH